MFKGSCTALITPFIEGRLDEDTFASMVERQIADGTNCLVPSGTTGESPTLTHDEHDRVTEICVAASQGRSTVIAGTGSNSTAEAITLTQHAQNAGADAALLIVPYYNKPSQEGLFQHYKAIHDNSDLPIILYNVPSRTMLDMAQDTIVRLAELPRIAGIKDATGDLSRPVDLSERLAAIRPDFAQISGEDDTILEFLEAGGISCISVTSNIAPKLCADMHKSWNKGDKDAARAIQQRLMPLHDVMFCETSPIPAKYAASLMGLCRAEWRLPLVAPSDESKEKIRSVLEDLELI